MLDIVEKARIFATAAHAAVGQVRKYTKAPYIVHPIEVMELVKQFNPTPEMLAAALLHDVVEDTKVDITTISDEFGPEVEYLVYWLTDKSTPEDGNRATRKAIDLENLALASADAQTIKLCDLCSNTSTIVEHDPGFARIYLKEKRALLDALVLADPRARQMATEVLEHAEVLLNMREH